MSQMLDDIPVQSYFRLNAKGAGQFEHTLIIVDEGASLHFIEGCSAKISGNLIMRRCWQECKTSIPPSMSRGISKRADEEP